MICHRPEKQNNNVKEQINKKHQIVHVSNVFLEHPVVSSLSSVDDSDFHSGRGDTFSRHKRLLNKIQTKIQSNRSRTIHAYVLVFDSHLERFRFRFLWFQSVFDVGQLFELVHISTDPSVGAFRKAVRLLGRYYWNNVSKNNSTHLDGRRNHSSSRTFSVELNACPFPCCSVVSHIPSATWRLLGFVLCKSGCGSCC